MVHTFWHWQTVLCSVASWSDLNKWSGWRWVGLGGVSGIFLLYDLSLRKRRPKIPLGFYRSLLAFCWFVNLKQVLFCHLYIYCFPPSCSFIYLFSILSSCFYFDMLFEMTIWPVYSHRERGKMWVKIVISGFMKDGEILVNWGDPIMHLIKDTSSTYHLSHHVFIKYVCAFSVNGVCACEYAWS